MTNPMTDRYLQKILIKVPYHIKPDPSRKQTVFSPRMPKEQYHNRAGTAKKKTKKKHAILTPARIHRVTLTILTPIGPEKHKTMLIEKCRQQTR